MISQILEWDRHLSQLINQQWHNAFFDWLFPLIRNKYTSIPIYISLLLFAIFKLKKNNYWWILFASILPAITDLVSSKLIKGNIWRYRPCADPLLKSSVRFIVEYCPHSSSFTSSHATSHFGMAVFYFITLKPFFGNWAYLFFLWAISIAYAQVYVGVHYPLDVICGAILGSFLGFIFAKTFNKKFILA